MERRVRLDWSNMGVTSPRTTMITLNNCFMARKRPYNLKGVAWDLRATWLLDDWFMKTAGWMKGPEETHSTGVAMGPSEPIGYRTNVFMKAVEWQGHDVTLPFDLMDI
jgi:hypothetical protein